MSFGYSVGDCIAVLQLANKLRERFIDAPKQFGAISAEVANLSNFLRNIENVFSQQELTDWQQKALASILLECRNVLIALGKVVDENYLLKPSDDHDFRDKSRRVWKRLTWDPKDIQELRQRVALNVGLLSAFNESLISKVTLDTRDEVHRLHERYDKRERNEEDQTILNWLTPIDYASQQHNFISRRQPGTGQWLVDSVKFQTWLHADKQTLFCPGIPGAGKTILTSIVIENLCTRFRNDDSVGIVHLYCNFKESHVQKLEDLLLSLLRQFLQQQTVIPNAVKSLYKQHSRSKTRPSSEEISKTLQSTISDFEKVFIVVDALDECQTHDRCRNKLISEIFDHKAKGANLFVTSRFIPEITEQFKTDTWLEIRASNDDLRRYLDGQIPRLPKCVSRSPDLQEKIKETIVKTVDGMFLLARLHLDSLIDKTTARKITDALAQLPKGPKALNLAYSEAIQRIRGQEADFVKLALRILAWITCVKRPLSCIELQHGLAINDGDSEIDEYNLEDMEEVVSLCAGLVTIDVDGGIIRLIHYTTQEYFEQTQNSLFPGADKDIAVACITYLTFDDFESGLCGMEKEFEARLQFHPLYEYASRYWGHHAYVAWTEVRHLALGLLQNERKVLACTQAMIASRSFRTSAYRVPKEMTGLHLAVYFELDEAILDLLSNGYHLESRDSFGRTPLSWAAEKGHRAIAKLLLEKGAEINSRDKSNQTPLFWATRNLHETTVILLLEKGAELDPSLLSWAARKGHEAIARSLIQRGAQLEAKPRHGQTPLLWAVQNGHEGVTRLLVEKNANLKSQNSEGRTPLFCAMEYGHEAIVRILIEGRADIESRNDGDQTPLRWAIKRGDEGLVRFLLEKGAEVEARNKYGETAWMCAAMNGHEGIVRLLLEKGAKVEVRDLNGYTALEYASKNGNEGLVRLLLEKGADIEVKNKYGYTALIYAAENGHEEVVKLLLEKGAEVGTRNIYSDQAFIYAAKNGHRKVVKLLLEKGADIEARNIYGSTALVNAAENGHEGVVKLLLEKGANIEVRDSYGYTALIYAAMRGYKGIARLLLKKGAKVEARNKGGWTPLKWAENKRHNEVAKLLLEYGAKPTSD